MKTKRKSENLCLTVCDVILCFLMVFVSLNDGVNGGMPNDNQKILSRRRRYLTFPEGTSFQVVYETYQPIPGYNNLLIFYLTQALAWELPSQAYHPEEHLQDLWDDVVFPNDQYDELVVNNQVANAAANNLQNSIQEKNSTDRNGNLKSPNGQGLAQNQQGVPLQLRTGEQSNGVNNYYAGQGSVQNQNQLKLRTGEQSNVVNNYYANGATGGFPNKYYSSNYQNPQKISGIMEPLTKTITNKMDYYLSYADKVLNQVTNLATEKHNPWKKTDWTYSQSQPNDLSYEQSEANRRKYAFDQSRHFIHPAFGKRSTDKNLSPEEMFNMNYHRSSRQTMYQKIAKFLDTDEINGAECVLKALCETGKRSDLDKKPGPFLMEILRVVFSLPETNQVENHPVYSQYDEAHATSKDCDELFPKCTSSLWNKDAII